MRDLHQPQLKQLPMWCKLKLMLTYVVYISGFKESTFWTTVGNSYPIEYSPPPISYLSSSHLFTSVLLSYASLPSSLSSSKWGGASSKWWSQLHGHSPLFLFLHKSCYFRTSTLRIHILWGLGLLLASATWSSREMICCSLMGQLSKRGAIIILVHTSNHFISHQAIIYCIPPCIWQVDCSSCEGWYFSNLLWLTLQLFQVLVHSPAWLAGSRPLWSSGTPNFVSLDLGDCQKFCSTSQPLQSLLLDWTDVPKGERTPKWQAYLFAVLFQVPWLKLLTPLLSV